MNLLPGVTGEGPLTVLNGRSYRQRLVRRWDEAAPARTILWIGMNPSTADAERDDRTCRREQCISRRFNFNHYLKGNILDLMETHSRNIPRDIGLARSGQNLDAIRQMCQEADWIVLAHGDLPMVFRQVVCQTYAIVRDSGRPISVFQYNRNERQIPTHTIRIMNENIPEYLEAVRRDI